MNFERKGKIARLPRAVREELNCRLQAGEQGKKLVPWLNGLPEVRAVVEAEFGDKPIREQNLSEWKQGGYREWEARQEAMEVAGRLSEEAAEWKAEGRAPLSESLVHWVEARLVVATRRVAEADGAEGWRLLHELCADIMELQRGNHSAERLRLEREQLELARERDREKTEEEFLAWAEKNRDTLCRGYRTNAEKIALLRKVAFADVDALQASGAVKIPS